MNKFYLSFAVIGSLTYIIWGYIVTRVNDGLLVDSFHHRFFVILPYLIFILYNYITKKLSFEYLAYFGIFLITADYCYLIALNNNIVHTTGLYVVLTASFAVINKKWFLSLYSVLFSAYCIFSILFISNTIIGKAHWANVITLIILMTFFGLWRIKDKEQLEFEYKNNIYKSKKLEELNNIAAQVAHDIKSPIMALENFVSSVTELEPSKLKIISDVANRINGIADYLVDEYRKSFTDAVSADRRKNVFEEQTIQELLISLKEEKLLLQSNFRKYNILIHGNIHYKINKPKLQLELKRMFSNIINNSIEAFQDEHGTIDLILYENEETFSVQIKDNGKGIPNHLLQAVFNRGATFNKSQGTGLGLSHAKETIQKLNGKIDLSSKENFGTLVQISIPKV